MRNALRDSLLLLLLLTVSLTAAGSAGTPCAKRVTDITGRSVCLPADIRQVAVTCYGGASQEIALLGGAGKIVAHPSTEYFPQFGAIYKRLAQTPSAGSFSDVNLEQMARLAPDIVFAGIVSKQMNERIRELGIPVVLLGIGHHRLEELLEEFTMVGRILGSERKAAALVAYWREKLALIRKKSAAVPASERRRVFYAQSGLKTEGAQWWGNEFIRLAGGVNVARGLKTKTPIGPEQLSVWNPDVIVTAAGRRDRASAKALLNGPLFRGLKAVREGRVYACPIGAFWWDRPSPEAILGILWLAKTLYPEAMKTVDLEAETKHFYRRFYGYSLSREEYDAFFGAPSPSLTRSEGTL